MRSAFKAGVSLGLGKRAAAATAINLQPIPKPANKFMNKPAPQAMPVPQPMPPAPQPTPPAGGMPGQAPSNPGGPVIPVPVVAKALDESPRLDQAEKDVIIGKIMAAIRGK